VSLIRDTYTRFKVLVHEVAKFGVVGIIGFVVQLVFTDALHYKFKVGALTAVLGGYIVATAVTFLGNKYWAFRHRKGSKSVGHETIYFILLNVVGIVIQLGVVDLVRDGFGMKGPLAYNLSIIVGIGLGTIFRLFTYRKWVFIAHPAAGGPGAEQLEPEPTGRR
jgi:putative flippase GtrA